MEPLKTKSATITLILFFQLFIFYSSVLAISESTQDSTLKRILEIDRAVHIEPAWSILTDTDLSPRPVRKSERVRNRSFILQTVIRGIDHFCAVKVKDTPMDIDLKLVSYGYAEVKILVDGEPADSFVIDGPPGTGSELLRSVRVTSRTKVKEYTVQLKVFNKGFKPFRTAFWPPRKTTLEEENSDFSLLEGMVSFPVADKNQTKLEDWLQSMKIAHALLNPDFKRYTFIGAPFEIPDKRKTSKKRLLELIDSLSRTVRCLDPILLEADQTKQLDDALNRSYQFSEPLRIFAKEFKIYLVGNAHIDIAWLWRMRETIEVARNTYETVINNMEEYPELRYAQSQAITYSWLEQKYPLIFERIKQMVKAGKWEIVGGMWVEPDCNLISGESWVRQLIFGKRFFKTRFGVEIDTGWNPDSFGYNWNMPQIYSKSGIKRFITQKIWWNDTTVFPYFVFWWQGVDGTKLLTYFPPAPYDTAVRFPQDTVNLTRYEVTTGYKKALLLYGIGDHGGGPNREILNRIRHYQKLEIAPDFIHSLSGDFLDNLEKDLQTSIPTWNDELYLEYHRGTYTTQARVKKNNRKAESSLSAAEKLASIAFLLGRLYPEDLLAQAWKIILTNQFHDILPGSSITPVYRDALEDYDDACQKIRATMNDSLAAIADKIDTTSITGVPLVVFNPLSWERSEPVTITLSDAEDRLIQVLDPSGEQIPCEIRHEPFSRQTSVSFVARRIPPIGYSTFSLKKIFKKAPEKKTGEPINPEEDEITLENRFFRLKINKNTGNISSLIDKRLKKEFVEPGKEANVMQIHEDRPERWDAWNIGYTGRKWDINKAESVELVEKNPVRQVVKIEKTFLGLSKGREAPTPDFPSSFFTQYIILYNGIDRIDIKTEADWWEDHMLLKVAFPVSISSDVASYEIPFAFIQRTTRFDSLWEKARFEVPALRWADLSDATAGISLLNDCKYGYDIHANVMRLTLLRSPTWPDTGADRGKHSFTYSIYTHPGNIAGSLTVKRAQELNIPLKTLITGNHPGHLPRTCSFFSVNSDSVILETVKKAEDDGGIIIRLYESLGKEAEARIEMRKNPGQVQETDLMEKPVKELKVTGKIIYLKFKKFEIKTLKLFFDQ